MSSAGSVLAASGAASTTTHRSSRGRPSEKERYAIGTPGSQAIPAPNCLELVLVEKGILRSRTTHREIARCNSPQSSPQLTGASTDPLAAPNGLVAALLNIPTGMPAVLAPHALGSLRSRRSPWSTEVSS